MRLALTAFLLTISLSFLVASTAHAQAKAPNTLKISPVRTDVEILPGTKKVVQVTATNLDTVPVIVKPIANDFIAGDERGTPALLLDDAAYAPTHSLKRFMSPLATTTLPPKGSKTINVVISVPANAQAGGYFGSVRLLPTDAQGGGQVNLTPSVASLILLKVPGAIVEDLRSTHFTLGKGDSSAFYFSSPQGIQLSTRFENKGNVQTAPLGTITVRKGAAIVQEFPFNMKQPYDVILPDSARRWDVPIKDLSSFGYYTVTAVFTYGEKNQTLLLEKRFIIAPVWMVITVVAGGILIVAGGVFGAIMGIRYFRRPRSSAKSGRTRKPAAPRRRF